MRRCCRTCFTPTWPPGQSSVARQSVSSGPGADPRALRRFRTDARLREAARMPRDHTVEGNRAASDDGCRAVDSAPAAPAEGLPAAGPARVSGRAGADRRQRASVVRGTGAGVHAAGVCRRCDQPADGAAFHGDRVDLQLLRGNARVSGTLWQAGGVLQRQGERVPLDAHADRRARRHALWPGDVRAEHRHVVREQQLREGPRRARPPDAAGPAGEGAAAARHPYH